jgi:TPR repeat protein
MRLLLAFTLLLTLLAQPAFAGFDEGKKAYDEKKWDQAIINLRPIAETGDARALVLLGNMYSRGYGVKLNMNEAYSLYRRAAVLGNAEAMVVTGALLQQGGGIKVDVPQAIKWYERSAKLGNAGGMFFYGLYLFRGYKAPEGSGQSDIIPDPAGAYQWLSLTSKHSDTPKLRDAATKLAAGLKEKMKAEDIEKAEKAIDDWKIAKLEDLGEPPTP